MQTEQDITVTGSPLTNELQFPRLMYIHLLLKLEEGTFKNIVCLFSIFLDSALIKT